ncbi:hypothetical protein FQN60_002825 [Etheostoma spectabile]|uniref:Cystatin domain-containing protein n=1 Tax=Etheostoma spectabile TaxID=54343 RepID=A0A5J5CHD2_9PERO|nr:hypothetical protein FQN60_002825 [Etheostoma spectabile]
MLFVWFCVFVSAFIGRFVTEQQILSDPQDVPVTDVKVLASAKFAVAELNKVNTWMTYRMVGITSAQVQALFQHGTTSWKRACGVQQPIPGLLIATAEPLVAIMLFVWFCVFVSAFIGRFVTEHSLVDGGFQDVPVNRTDVLEAAQFAVVEFNKLNTEDVFNYAILNTISAKMQVVGGFNYFLEMLLGRATCKTAANDSWNYILEMHLRRTMCNTAANKPCNSEPKASKLVCHFTVYYSLGKPRSLTTSECTENGN